MNRRQFLQNLILVPLALNIKVSTATNESLVITNTPQKRKGEVVPVAGFQYYKGEQLWSKLEVGNTLELVREHNNKFDDNAIIIQWQGRQLGYIPQVDNKPFAKIMDEGKKLNAEITSLSTSENPWERVEVAVFQMIFE